MTIINGDLLRDMQSRLRRGETYKQIARRAGLDVGTVYHRLYRAGSSFLSIDVDRNANRPDRVTRWAFNNGGCSTLSGPVPVTLPRLRCLESDAPNMAVAA